MNPKVSVIIPTYNRGEIVPSAVESVLRQTYSDYELIVIDDGSTDNTGERLHKYGEKLRYVRQMNRGMSAARNAGVNLAKGKWIAFLDSDDIWHPTKLERQFEALDLLGGEFGACVTDCRYVGDARLTLTAFESVGFEPKSECGPFYGVMHYLLWENTFAVFVQSLLVLRSDFCDAGGFDESFLIHEDRDLMFRLSFRTRFCYVSAPLVDIDRTPDLSRLSDRCFRRDDIRCAQDEALCEKMLSHPQFLNQQERQAVRDELNRIYYDWAAARAGDLRFPSAWRVISKLRQMGQSYRTIFRVLLSRMGRKLSRTVQPASAQQ